MCVIFVFIRCIPTGLSSISGVRCITLRIVAGIAGTIVADGAFIGRVIRKCTGIRSIRGTSIAGRISGGMILRRDIPRKSQAVITQPRHVLRVRKQDRESPDISRISIRWQNLPARTGNRRCILPVRTRSRKPVRARTEVPRKKGEKEICVECEDDVSLAQVFLGHTGFLRTRAGLGILCAM